MRVVLIMSDTIHLGRAYACLVWAREQQRKRRTSYAGSAALSLLGKQSLLANTRWTRHVPENPREASKARQPIANASKGAADCHPAYQVLFSFPDCPL